MLAKKIRIVDFMNTEYKQFATYDNIINLPNFYDGLKISQRKVLYSALKKNQHVKVASLASFAAEYSEYHHAEKGLSSVIINLARNYKGSNNFEYMIPDGNFGSTLVPVPAADRYIHTSMSDTFKQFFTEDDLKIVKHIYYDDNKVEPYYYIPLIPTVFLNGSRGLGNGFSTNIFPRNPLDIINYIINTLTDKPKNKINAYIRGYKGDVLMEGSKLTMKGVISLTRKTLMIEEVPTAYDLDKYREVLDTLINKKIISDFTDYSHGDEFKFACKLYPDVNTDHDYLMKTFKLINNQGENITVWYKNNVRKFETIEEYIDLFIIDRLGFYKERIDKLVYDLTSESKDIYEYITFIEYVINNFDIVVKYKKSELLQLLKDLNISNTNIINTPIYKFTEEQLLEYKVDHKQKQERIAYYQGLDVKSLYIEELISLLKSVTKIMKTKGV